MQNEMYNVIGSEEEMRWFFDHALFPLQICESYSFVLCSRHKKLSKEEQQRLGMTRKSAEFLRTEALKRPGVVTGGTDEEFEESVRNNISFGNLLRTIARFNVDKRAYTTDKGLPIPEETLSVLCYVNPTDDMQVWDNIEKKMNDAKTSIARCSMTLSLAQQNKAKGVLAQLSMFSKLASHIKHEQAQCKGSVYWKDFDFDVGETFKKEKYEEMHAYLESKIGLGKFIIVDTSGGYHILVRTSAIHWPPQTICDDLLKIAEGYLDERSECILNNSGKIPGLPLPGTLQYGRLVTVVNKGDFNEKSNHRA